MNNVIINKTKVLLPLGYVTLANFVYPVYSLWFYYFQNTFWLSNLSILSVPEGYSRNTSFAKTLIITFLLDRTVFYINPIQNEHPIKSPGNVSLVKISSDTNLDSFTYFTYSTSSHGGHRATQVPKIVMPRGDKI
jgi:hypothetical protein